VKAKRTGSIGQVIECLPRKYKTLNSNPKYYQRERISGLDAWLGGKAERFQNRQKTKGMLTSFSSLLKVTSPNK
jgi:hypothetical protein